MGTKTQTAKNIELTHKLIEYLLRGKNVPDLPEDVSFVPFSKTDKKLNKENDKLLKSIYQEGKRVAKAEESKTSKGSWEITPVNF
ncbi:hypothetical protein HY404_01255 [Candidatus Microgenomates bacterium]|nr:hypothetical protein [Candidatus Microgenomates bacterium]